MDKKTLPACVLARPASSSGGTSSHTECNTSGECKPQVLEQDQSNNRETISPRIVAIGDIHGSINGLLENLFQANITVSKTRCEWQQQTHPTIVVQMGDYVDRGSGALESLRCMKDLQAKAASYNGEVVRIVGSK
jgi:hypothetical protein